MRDNLGRFMKGTHWRTPQAFREKEYLEREYGEKQRTVAEIAADFGVSRSAVDFWMRRHGIPQRSMSEVRKLKRWGAFGPANPMYGRRGAEAPAWRGGVMPERQMLMHTPEWAEAVLAVWERDGGQCRRCGRAPRDAKAKRLFHVHHIEDYRNRALFAEPSNLVLLCHRCHKFVHSKANTAKEFLMGGGDAE